MSESKAMQPRYMPAPYNPSDCEKPPEYVHTDPQPRKSTANNERVHTRSSSTERTARLKQNHRGQIQPFRAEDPVQFPPAALSVESPMPLDGPYQVIIVADPESTKATPSQLNFPTSPKRSTIGDCTSATMVLSSEKRKVDERIVRTIRIH